MHHNHERLEASEQQSWDFWWAAVGAGGSDEGTGATEAIKGFGGLIFVFSSGVFLGALNKPTANPTMGGSDLPVNLDVVDSILVNFVPGSQLLQLGSDKLSGLLVNLWIQSIGTSVTLEPNLLGLTGAIL